MLDKQMAIYTAEGIGESLVPLCPFLLILISTSAWSIWAYKDINVMGMTHLAPSSPWMRLLAPLLEKKRSLAVDSWAYDDAHLQEGLFGPLHKWFEDNVPTKYSKKYPWQWRMHMHVFRGIRGITMAEYMIPEFADYFQGLGFEQLDELAASWKFENCVGRERLNEVLKLYATMGPEDKRLEGKVIPKALVMDDNEGVFELSPTEKQSLRVTIADAIIV
jgi:endoglucanase